MKPVKPSGTPNPPSDPKRSTISWTIPEPGDVLSYSYLWAREAAEGREEGLKDRPVVVVVARTERDGLTQLLVAPVTHSRPDRNEDGIPIPPRVKKHLGLDEEESWIVVTELNGFIWPGPDIRVAPGSDSPLYDALPAKLFRQVQQGIGRHAAGPAFRMTKRTE
jgi:hypothetical protein